MNRSVSLRTAVLVTVVLLIAINVIALPLRNAAAPLGVVSLQAAPTLAAAEAILASWESVDRWRLLVAHGLDVLLPFAYAGALGLAARRRGVRRAAILAVVAASADQLENLAMTFTILEGPTMLLVRTTLLAAILKWGALTLSLVMLGRRVSATARPAVSA